jgi:hypothetical protein
VNKGGLATTRLISTKSYTLVAAKGITNKIEDNCQLICLSEVLAIVLRFILKYAS